MGRVISPVKVTRCIRGRLPCEGITSSTDSGALSTVIVGRAKRMAAPTVSVKSSGVW